jgi:hypothetical protein
MISDDRQGSDDKAKKKKQKSENCWIVRKLGLREEESYIKKKEKHELD